MTAKSFLDMTEEERANLPEMQYLDLINGPPPFTSYFDEELGQTVRQWQDGRRFTVRMMGGKLVEFDELAPEPGSPAELAWMRGRKAATVRHGSGDSRRDSRKSPKGTGRSEIKSRSFAGVREARSNRSTGTINKDAAGPVGGQRPQGKRKASAR
jgi:hypothetical protein